jgi:superfamily II DNA or RNA helicase
MNDSANNTPLPIYELSSWLRSLSDRIDQGELDDEQLRKVSDLFISYRFQEESESESESGEFSSEEMMKFISLGWYMYTIKYHEYIDNDLHIKLEEKKYSRGRERWIYPHRIVNDDIYLPFSYAKKKIKLKRPERNNYGQIVVNFEKKLRPEQKVVKSEAIDLLNKKGSVLLALYCGFGKSATSMNLACTIGMKTLIVVNKIVLMRQWEEGLKFFCPAARVQRLTPKSKIKSSVDFYIINAINIPKLATSGVFRDIGTLIIDECHLIMAETLSKSMQYLCPRYVIGLSATPYRPDGLNILLELYFGKHKIFRKLYRQHTVYQVNTKFVPTVELAQNGRVNWGLILESQASDPQRNELIIDLVKRFKERTFLILVKRIQQGRLLVKRLEEEGEDVTCLFGSNQEFSVESRILVGTSSKVGVGFDHPKLDSLLLAADLEQYFIQYLGRVFRTKDVEPIIFDLVDNNPILKKHFYSRKKVYQAHGGTIKLFKQ